jgi:hypothetical protein
MEANWGDLKVVHKYSANVHGRSANVHMCAMCMKYMYVLYGCFFIGVYGCVWVCMGVYGCVWVCMGVYGCVWVCMGGSLSSASAGYEGGGGGGIGDASFRFRISHPNLPGLGFRV